MAAPSMVTRDGDNLVVRSVVSGDELFGTKEKEDASTETPPEEPPPAQEFLPQTRVKRNYTCSKCDFSTQNPRSFLHHQKDEHKEKFKIFECPRCLYATKHNQKLHRHMHMVHVLGSYKRKPLPRVRRVRPAPRPEPPKPPPPPLPDDTEFTLSDDGTSIIYKCSVCSFQTKSQTALVRHERIIHLKKKFYRCNKCDYVTHIRARYTKHVKYHSMPMIKCEICDFRTPYKWNLERHNKNHQGDGAFKCEMCNFTADIKQSLTVHELNHHVNGPVRVASSRRRYRVGASDNLPPDDQLDILRLESREANHLSRAQKKIIVKELFKKREEVKDGQNEVMGTLVEIPVEGQVRVRCGSCMFSHESLQVVRAHEASEHGAKKPARPIPNLIPITAKKQDKEVNEACLKSSSLKDFASLIGDDNAFSGDDFKLPQKQVASLKFSSSRSSSPESADSKKEGKRKSSSFFDKLQEKLMTSSIESDLLCSVCGYEAKCLSELVKHKESQHPEEEATESATCQMCGLVCSSIGELQEHAESCGEAGRDSPDRHPMENRVFVWNTFQPNEDSPPQDEPSLPIPDKVGDTNIYLGVEVKPGYGNASILADADEETKKKNLYARKAYKCPHCDFWASTASRFHVHIVGHLNKRPFRCSLCQYSSNWRWDITKHIRLKGFRDPDHQGARVLLTDEAGMRDYTKYNRYLAVIKVDVQNNTPQKRILPRILPATPNTPPGNQLFKRLNFSESEVPPSKRSKFANTKKMWKCKKCQYRNSDKQVVLAHVKSHYYNDMKKMNGVVLGPPGPLEPPPPPTISPSPLTAPSTPIRSRPSTPCSTTSTNAGKNKSSRRSSVAESENGENAEYPEYMCETCPFEASSMTDLEEHAEKHFVTHGTNFKCKVCPYYARDQQDLDDHFLLHGNDSSDDSMGQRSVIYPCLKCPYYGEKKAQLLYHRKWHDSPTETKHVCPKCTYSAPNNIILALHVRLHRHSDVGEVKKVLVPPKPSPSTPMSSYADISGVDTSKMNEIPLAWVCKGSRVSKMFKCRFCPHVNIRKPNIVEHEKMHADRSPNKNGTGTLHRCNLCNYASNNAGVLSSHIKVHQAFYGTVCAIADACRSDEEQIEEVKQKMIQDELSDLKGDAVVGQMTAEVKPGVERLIHFCSICPARFLYPKELMIHCRFHVLNLPFRCETCTYTARQRQHLFIHKKVHTNDYHERTKILLMSYSESPENPRPDLVNESQNNGFLWVVSKEQEKKLIKCHKCPAKLEDKEAFDRHVGFHGWPGGKFKCKFCDFTVLLFDTLIDHELLHITEDEPETPTEVKPTKMEEPEKPNKFIDPEFGTQIQGSPSFVYPTMMRNGKKKEKKYKCHKCPSAFEKREQYKIHISLHGSKQRYKCDKCDYSVKYYANYVQHVRKHNVESQGKDSNDGGNTDEMASEDNSNDLRQSLEDAPSQVERAGKTMNMCLADEQTIEIMKQREAKSRFNGEAVFRCPSCPYMNPRRDAVVSHLKCHAIVKGKTSNYSCKYCDYRSPQGRYFKEHVKSHFAALKYNRPEAYMKINQLEIWAEPMDQNENTEKFLVFKDQGEDLETDRFVPKMEYPHFQPTSPRGRVYINLKTGEEEIEMDDEVPEDNEILQVFRPGKQVSSIDLNAVVKEEDGIEVDPESANTEEQDKLEENLDNSVVENGTVSTEVENGEDTPQPAVSCGESEDTSSSSSSSATSSSNCSSATNPSQD